MKYMNRITTLGGGLSFMAVAGCLLYAMFAYATTDSDCESAWNDAPASSYCSIPSYGYESMTGLRNAPAGYCGIQSTGCSIEVDMVLPGVASVDETFTPEFPSSWWPTVNDRGQTKAINRAASV